MKLFLKKCLLFATMLIVSAYSMDYAITTGLKKAKVSSWNVGKDIFENNVNANVLILGNSRAYRHINPLILDSILNVNSYNLGISSAFLNVQQTMYKYFFQRNTYPQTIIYSADNKLLALGDYNKEYIMPYINKLDKGDLKEIGFSYFDALLPLVRYCHYFELINTAKNELIGKHRADDSYKGFFAQDLSYNGFELELLISKGGISANKEPEMIKLFDKFLAECKAKGIKVIMVFTPQYIRATEHTKDFDAVIKIYNDFSKKYDFPFLDYSHDSLCYDTTYFYNAIHLNKNGADLFSIKLANDIKELDIINNFANQNK